MKNGVFLHQPVTNQTNYIVDGLIARNRLAIWASPPGEGKSLMAQVLGYSVAYEAPFLGMRVSGGNIMFIDSENRYDVLKNRCIKIKMGLEMDGYTMKGEVDFQHYSGFLLDDISTWIDIKKEINSIQPVLIILDHLACFHHQDEDRQTAMSKVTDALEEIMRIESSSLLPLHHFNKRDKGNFFRRLRGSSAIYAKTDAACEVRSLSFNDGRLEKVGLIPQPRKEITPAPIRVKIEEGADWIKLINDGTYRPIEDPVMDKICHDIYHLFPSSQLEQSVYDVKRTIAGYASDAELREALRTLENMGLLIKKVTASGKFVYNLKNPRCPWCSP